MTPSTPTPHPDQIDRLMALYCEWRTTCWNVRSSYDRFCAADQRRRDLAFGVYSAALDREEAIAEAYAAQIRLVSAQLVDDPVTDAAHARG
ncbi:MAG: hypothetical protein WAL63_20305 [Solirubrobacteraceae bacterium]